MIFNSIFIKLLFFIHSAIVLLYLIINLSIIPVIYAYILFYSYEKTNIQLLFQTLKSYVKLKMSSAKPLQTQRNSSLCFL